MHDTLIEDLIDAEVVRKDFPLLAREVHGRPTRLPRLRRVLPPAPGRAGRDGRTTTRRRTPTSTAASTPSPRRPTAATRPPGCWPAGSSAPPTRARGDLSPRTPPRRSTSSPPPGAGRTCGPATSVLLTEMEHHANLVPWLMLADERGIELRYLPVDGDCRLDLSDLDRLLDGVKLVGVTAMSNVLGTINPLARIAEAAHAAGALVVADGAQSVPHLPVDVAALGVDFLAFSAHKMLGPTGIGVLWGRAEPARGHAAVPRRRRDDPRRPARRLPTGRQPAAVRGRHAADRRGGRPGRRRRLPRGRRDGPPSGPTSNGSPPTRSAPWPTGSATDCRVFGPPAGDDRGGVLSLAYRDVHPHDLAQVLDQYGVCVRPGHHCAKPLMRRLGVPATARASFCLYNDEDDVDVLIEGLAEAGRLFGSMPDLEDLYREIILDHYRSPRNRGELSRRRPTGSRGSTRSAATRSSSRSTSTTAGSPTSRSPGPAARSASRRPRSCPPRSRASRSTRCIG